MIDWRDIFDRFKSLFTLIIETIKYISSYWIYIWPALFALGVLSDRIWGDDNKFEQSLEVINKLETGANVDISTETESAKDNDLKKYVPNER